MSQLRPSRNSRTSTATLALLVVAGSALILGAPRRAAAQAGPSSGTQASTPVTPTPKTHPNDPSVWDVDKMMDDAATQIARRYNLNKPQERYTRLVLVKRVKAFLEDHESDVRDLLKESIVLRLKNGTEAEYKKWAERAEPVYEAAMKAIWDGNQEWGGILNEDQKKIHESDLAQMQRSFDNVKRMLLKWKGEDAAALPVRIGSGPPPETVGRVAPNPPQSDIEDSWLQYVRKFTFSYKLDDEQTAAAQAIHKEEHQRATQYRDSHRRDILMNRARLTGAKDPATRARLEQKRLELELRSFQEIFVRLEKRLDASLTQRQRAAVSGDDKRVLQRMADNFSGRSQQKSTRAQAVKPKPDPKPTDADKKQPKATADKPAKTSPSSKPVTGTEKAVAPAKSGGVKAVRPKPEKKSDTAPPKTDKKTGGKPVGSGGR